MSLVPEILNCIAHILLLLPHCLAAPVISYHYHHDGAGSLHNNDVRSIEPAADSRLSASTAGSERPPPPPASPVSLPGSAPAPAPASPSGSTTPLDAHLIMRLIQGPDAERAALERLLAEHGRNPLGRSWGEVSGEVDIHEKKKMGGDMEGEAEGEGEGRLEEENGRGLEEVILVPLVECGRWEAEAKEGKSQRQGQGGEKKVADEAEMDVGRWWCY